MTEKYLIVKLPESQHKAFKVACAELGMSQAEILRGLLQIFLMQTKEAKK